MTVALLTVATAVSRRVRAPRLPGAPTERGGYKLAILCAATKTVGEKDEPLGKIADVRQDIGAKVGKRDLR